MHKLYRLLLYFFLRISTTLYRNTQTEIIPKAWTYNMVKIITQIWRSSHLSVSHHPSKNGLISNTPSKVTFRNLFCAFISCITKSATRLSKYRIKNNFRRQYGLLASANQKSICGTLSHSAAARHPTTYSVENSICFSTGFFGARKNFHQNKTNIVALWLNT